MACVFTSILCAVDFSETSKRAVSVAADLARLSHAHLTLVTVLDPMLHAASPGQMHEQTQRELDALLDRVWPGRQSGREPIAVTIAVGNPADEIVKQAAECGSDLIVMGKQGLGAVDRLMFGSVVEKVIRSATIAVLAVPGPPDE